MKPPGAATVNGVHACCDMQVKVVNNKTSLKNVSNRAVKTSEINFKPLAGKAFYLDLPVSKSSENLEKDIQILGGKIEGFLSKDISYLISNKKEAKFAQSFGRNSPVPSPDSAPRGNSSPHPSSRRGSQDGSSHRPVEAAFMSRGKSLVKKVIREQELIPVSSVLSNALAWGIRILFIDDIKSYIEKKKKDLSLVQKSCSLKEKVKSHAAPREAAKKTKAGILKKPFIKVEDRSCHYRPLYIQLPNFPVITYHTPRPYSPFDMDKTNKHAAAKLRNSEHRMTNSEHDNEMRIRPVQTLREKKRKKGYCECCMVKYDDLALHLKSEQHRKFAEGSQYQVVDSVIAQLMHNSVVCKNDLRRTKCSAGVFLDLSVPLRIAEKGSRKNTPQKGIHVSVLPSSCYTNAHGETETSHTETKEQAVIQQISILPEVSCSLPSFAALSPADAVKLNNINTESRELDENITPSVSVIDAECPSVYDEPEYKEERMRHETLLKLNNVHALCQDDTRFSCVLSETGDINGSGALPKENILNTIDEHILKCQSETITYQKRKQDSMNVCPSKYSRLKDPDSAFYVSHDACDKKEVQKEHLPLDVAYLTCASPAKKENTLEGKGSNASHDSSCRKLYRKVKFSSSRRKRGKQTHTKHNKQNEEMLVSEAILSSPVKRLFDLFQSTDSLTSEFLGFTCSFIEDCSQIDLSQDGSLWSLFAHSSYSSFYGF